MADFVGKSYIPADIVNIKSGTTQPPTSIIYPKDQMQFVQRANLGGIMAGLGRFLYRGTINGAFVYNIGVPPEGATNVVVISQV